MCSRPVFAKAIARCATRCRAGATSLRAADVRVIAATNKPLAEQVAVGRFREDLFYRLNVVNMNLPPLARRREDIPLLSQHFIERVNAQRGTHVQGFPKRRCSGWTTVSTS